jgi:hypothetical protein
LTILNYVPGNATTKLYDQTVNTGISNILFYSGNTTTTGYLGNGGFSGSQIIPVPEPEVIITTLLLLSGLFYSQRLLFMPYLKRFLTILLSVFFEWQSDNWHSR